MQWHSKRRLFRNIIVYLTNTGKLLIVALHEISEKITMNRLSQTIGKECHGANLAICYGCPGALH